MSAVPVWIQILQALLTPTIAVAVGVIGFLQWRTAHQKVMLDLFDRRIRVYETTIDAVLGYSHKQEGMDGSKALSLLRRAYTDARFLFGDEVAVNIEDLSDKIHQHRRLERKIDSRNVSDEDRSRLIDEIADVEDELDKMMAPWTSLLLPYLKMDQRQVRTPSQWFAERNKIRLSYADEKQR
jgi:hypothetical protein